MFEIETYELRGGTTLDGYAPGEAHLTGSMRLLGTKEDQIKEAFKKGRGHTSLDF